MSGVPRISKKKRKKGGPFVSPISLQDSEAHGFGAGLPSNDRTHPELHTDSEDPCLLRVTHPAGSPAECIRLWLFYISTKCGQQQLVLSVGNARTFFVFCLLVLFCFKWPPSEKPRLQTEVLTLSPLQVCATLLEPTPLAGKGAQLEATAFLHSLPVLPPSHSILCLWQAFNKHLVPRTEVASLLHGVFPKALICFRG